MKGKKIIDVLQYADEKYIAEADPEKSLPIYLNKKLIKIASVFLIFVVGGFVLFFPFYAEKELSYYEGNDYYEVIKRVYPLLPSNKPKNNFELLMSNLKSSYLFDDRSKSDDFTPDEPMKSDESTFTYHETTDNQVDGVIEGNLIKRSDKYIYYLDRTTLRVFSIKGTESKEVGSYDIKKNDEHISIYDQEIFLSDDCNTVIVITNTRKETSHNTYMYVNLISLDVSNPSNIKKTGYISINGTYVSSRITDGKLLFVTEADFYGENIKFKKPKTFVPSIDTGNGYKPISIDSIFIPENNDYKLSDCSYTTAILLDADTLKINDIATWFSDGYHRNHDIYVTDEHLYFTYEYVNENNHKQYNSYVKTDVTCLDYASEKFEKNGNFTVEGYVKDKWSMDEYNGIMRVVTTTKRIYEVYEGAGQTSFSEEYNANIYCIDTSSWEIIGSVEQFAPENETVKSVRFDKNIAYVCTAIRRTDPVFAFDLSDVNNITYNDTGTISGFSNSLINMKNGYWLGVGETTFTTLKLELYKDTGDEVESVAVEIIKNINFSKNYKAYYVDRENGLLGIGTNNFSDLNGNYLLFHIGKDSIEKLLCCDIYGVCECYRGIVIDNFLYTFGENCFKVCAIPQNIN